MKANRRSITLAVFVVLLVLGLCGCGKDNKTDTTSSEAPAKEQKKEEPVEEPEPEPEPEPESEFAYMDNEALETFFETYNALSASPMEDIDKGNIDTKYYAHTYNTWCEVLYPTGGGMCVTITATNDNDTRNVFCDDMRNAFHDVVKTLNPDISDDAIAAAFDGAIGGELTGTLDNVAYCFYTHTGVGGNRIDLARDPATI